MEKHCVTCDEDGHTYLECPRVNFGDLLMASFGMRPIGTTPEALREELDKIERERDAKGGPRVRSCPGCYAAFFDETGANPLCRDCR